MKKYFISIGRYEGEKDRLYEQFISPRNELFCKIHGIKYIKVGKDIQLNNKEIFSVHYIRFWIIKQALLSNKIQDGDIVYHYDADILIAKLDKCIMPTKSYTYAIDSGNTHIAGMFCMIINSFTRQLIDLYLNVDNILKAQQIPLFNEYSMRMEPMWAHDQYMYYHYTGIKPHSWMPFAYLPDNGFHSCVTPLTVFSLEELRNNVEILPSCWNVTQILEDTGDTEGKPCWFDINRCNKEDVINRHFAGGHKWLVEKWLDYLKPYDKLLNL